MQKKIAVAFLLSFLVIMGYNYFLSQKYPQTAQGSLQQQPSLPHQLGQQTEPALSKFKQPPAKSKQTLSSAIAQAPEIIVETDLMRLVLTSSGARIKSCQLKGYPEGKFQMSKIQTQIQGLERSLARASVQDQPRLKRQKDKLEILSTRIGQQPDKAELVSLAASLEYSFTPELVLPEDEDLTYKLNNGIYRCPLWSLTLDRQRPQGKAEFIFTDQQGRRLKKIFSFSNSSYIIGLEIVLANWEKEYIASKHLLVFSGPDIGLPEMQQGRRGYTYTGPVTYYLTAQQGWLEKEKYGRQEQDIFVQREHTGKIAWVGLENKYFLTALIPNQPLERVVVQKNEHGEQKIALAMPWNNPANFNLQIYLGPKKRELLKDLDITLEKTIDYGFFSPIARLIYTVLVFFSKWTHNFGWAIVLLCLVTKVVFYPLTHHSFEAMQKMQQQMKTLQPEMEALREKLKDKPQKLNKEIMELYRRKGINPLSSCQSGCLPLVLQMPVFFALYAVLYNSIELRGAPFVGWITDLAAKDPYYVLPILMGISMFIQQKLTGMGGAGGGAQQEQAKIMAVMMPILLTWIFASLPAGVVLYWLTFNILTAAQQLLIKKQRATATT